MNSTALRNAYLILALSVTGVVVPGARLLAAEVDLAGLQIRLKSDFSQFKDASGTNKAAPQGARLLILGEGTDASTAKKIFNVQLSGTLPESGIKPENMLKQYETYTVEQDAFRAAWVLDPQGASAATQSSAANLTGSRLKMRADFSGLLGPDGSKATVVKDQIVDVREAGENTLKLTVRDKDDCTHRHHGDPKVCAEEGPLYEAKPSELTRAYYDRTGWAYGPLFVPFKMRFKDKSITGEAALGGFLGYEWRPFGISLTPIMHAGLSVVTVGGSNTAANNINDTTNKPAFTWGLGLIMKPGDNYQAALILGTDRIGGSDGRTWDYEGKWWLSVAIGYNFGR